MVRRRYSRVGVGDERVGSVVGFDSPVPGRSESDREQVRPRVAGVERVRARQGRAPVRRREPDRPAVVGIDVSESVVHRDPEGRRRALCRGPRQTGDRETHRQARGDVQVHDRAADARIAQVTDSQSL